MIVNYFKILILLIITSVSSFGQNLKEDLKAMGEFYSSDQFLTIDIGVKIFQNHSASPSFVQSAKIQKKGKSFFYEFNGSKMVVSDSSILMLHENEKTALLKPITPKQYDDYIRNMVSFNMDSVLARYDSVVYKGTMQGLKKYLIYSSKGVISKAELFLNASTLMLTRVLYEYSEKVMGQANKAEISFASSSLPFNENLISLSRFISKTGNEYKLKSAYSTYNLILVNDED